MPSNGKACHLNPTPTMLWVYAIGCCQAIFVTAGIACSHGMSTWYSSPNIEERYLTETLSSGSQSCSRKFTLTSRRNSSRGTVRPNTYTCSSTTHPSTRCRAWSTVSKAFPVDCSVSSGLILRNAIGRMSCGRRLTLPPVAAGHRWASSSNTLSNKRPRFNPPYIPALKDRGFTARLVRRCAGNHLTGCRT